MRAIQVIIAVLFLPALCIAQTTLQVPQQFPTIQAAIDAADSGDTVLVDDGTYMENIDFIGKDITVRSVNGPDVTVIDGGKPVDPRYASVVAFKNGEMNSVLDGFTLTNGTGTERPTDPLHAGGGIYCLSSSPTIMNNIIEWNTVTANGGGITCRDGSKAILTHNIIRNNVADNCGGGIACAYDSDVAIMDNKIYNNIVLDSGGGIICSYDCDATIFDNEIHHNTAHQYGSGIVCGYNSNAHISNNEVYENTADIKGGGIRCRSSSPLIENNVIRNNSANQFGGGFDIVKWSSPTIRNNIIMENEVSDHGGGGIWMAQSGGLITQNLIVGNSSKGENYCGGGIGMNECTPVISSNVIHGNHSNKGGGIDCAYSAPVVVNCTIVGNTSIRGGGIACRQTSNMEIVNTILWDNDAPTGPEGFLGPTSQPSEVSISYSDVDGGEPSFHVEPQCTLNWGSGMIDANPLFVNAVIGDFHLTYPSPCKDTGDSTVVAEPYDFEGDPRIAYGAVDMGADEFYTHLYYTGKAAPGGFVEIKMTGIPGTTPVALFIGFGVYDPPFNSMWGDWYVAYPWLGPIDLGSIPNPMGVLILSGNLPSSPPGPYTIYMQAIVGDMLTNPCTMKIE